jgi:hypothetical protein
LKKKGKSFKNLPVYVLVVYSQVIEQKIFLVRSPGHNMTLMRLKVHQGQRQKIGIRGQAGTAMRLDASGRPPDTTKGENAYYECAQETLVSQSCAQADEHS